MMADGLVVIVIPTGVIPLRVLEISTRTGALGRRFTCHCLWVPALMVRRIAAMASSVDA
ncbi:MAG: hypothetical protein NVS4B4_17170 [Bradyrhizobium sp.]